MVITLGVIASVCLIVMAFVVNRKVILVSSVATSVVTGLQYCLLNEASTVFLIAVSLLYSALLMAEKSLPFVRTNGFTSLVLAAQTGGYFLFEGFSLNIGLLALAATVIGTAALWFENAVQLKLAMLMTGVIWLSFQLAVGAFGQLPGEIVFLTGVTYSLLMLFKAHRNGIPFHEVQELPALIKQKLRKKVSVTQMVGNTPELAEIAA